MIGIQIMKEILNLIDRYIKKESSYLTGRTNLTG